MSEGNQIADYLFVDRGSLVSLPFRELTTQQSSFNELPKFLEHHHLSSSHFTPENIFEVYAVPSGEHVVALVVFADDKMKQTFRENVPERGRYVWDTALDWKRRGEIVTSFRDVELLKEFTRWRQEWARKAAETKKNSATN